MNIKKQISCKFLLWYSNRLESHPLTTKAISSVMIFALGDFLCQNIERHIQTDTRKNKIDYKRLIKQSSYGFFAGPYLHLQFCLVIPWLFPATSKFYIIKSVIYALTISDSIYNCGFYFYCDALNGNFFKIQTFVDKFIPTQILNLKVWPIFQYINFSLIPIKYRVLYDNTLAIFWNAYLSWVENNQVNKKSFCDK